MSTSVATAEKRPLLTRIDNHVLRLVLLLLALLVIFAIVRTENFMAEGTWQSMAIQFPEFGVMALGVMLTMVTGGIDLSVVGIANMSSIVAATVMMGMVDPNSPDTNMGAIGAAVVVSLLLGALAGALNGYLVSVTRIPPILATLGTLFLFTGIAVVVSKGKPVPGYYPYADVMGGAVAGIPTPMLLFVVTALVVGFLLHRTSYGSKLYMIGTNATAARFSGLNSVSLLIRTYLVSGMCASVAGLIMLANYNSAKADYGASYTLLTVLIVVLGGVNPNGGSGRLSGVVLSILVLQVLGSALNTFPEISNFYRPLIWGAVLLLVISFSQFRGGTRRALRKSNSNQEVK